MSRLLFGVLLVSSTFGAVFACSSSASDPPATSPADAAIEEEDTGTSAPDASPKDAATCEPVVNTGRKTCDDCLKKNCCVALNNCFDDPSCDAYNTCYLDCGKKSVDDAGLRDCLLVCTNKYPNASQKLLDALECQNTSCGAACKR